MKADSVEDIEVPTRLGGEKTFASEEELSRWENELVAFFSPQYALFTEYPDYFKTRCYEFKVLRQLLPEFLGHGCVYERGLEIGCGFGYKTLLLSRLCDSLLGVDIPDKYTGYVRGNYGTSVEIARLLVNEKFRLPRVAFEAVWPDDMPNVENGSISLLFSEYCLEHMPDLTKSIREMHRVMRKDGVMIHVVPNTKDAALQFIKAQIDASAGGLIKMLAKRILGKRSPKVKFNGIVIPECHSEFISDYWRQFEVYTLENYLFPMVEAGFRIEKIVSTREHNDVIVARK